MPWFATELMFFNAIIIAFACAFTFVEGGHVRVDLVYSALEHGKKDQLLKRVSEMKTQVPNRPLEEIYDQAYIEVMNT